MSSISVSRLLLIAVCISFYVNEADSKKFQLQSRVIGGRDATNGEFPYMASIKDYSSMDHFCGGAIISDQHILTAAHCLQGHRSIANNIFAVVGTLRRKGGGILMKINNVTIHANFKLETLRNDIAMLHTVEKMIFSKAIKPIALPKTDISRGGGLPVILSGFGRIWEPSTTMPNFNLPHTLQWIQTLTQTRRQCFILLERSKLVLENFHDWLRAVESLGDDTICTVNKIDEGVCIGDSGSPLISQNDNTLVGIVSWTIGCAEGYPDVYTNVYQYHRWIDYFMKLSKPKRFFDDIFKFVKP